MTYQRIKSLRPLYLYQGHIFFDTFKGCEVYDPIQFKSPYKYEVNSYQFLHGLLIHIDELICSKVDYGDLKE